MGDHVERVQWDTFCFNLNKVQYSRASNNLVNRINDKYHEFNQKLNTGKMAEGKEILFDALRLENAIDMEKTHDSLIPY